MSTRVGINGFGRIGRNLLRAAHVVTLRVSEYEGCQTGDAEVAQLLCDLGLGRTLVDKHGPFRHLDENRIALADVEEGETKARRRRQPAGREQLPDDESGHDGGHARERRRSPPAR